MVQAYVQPNLYRVGYALVPPSLSITFFLSLHIKDISPYIIIYWKCGNSGQRFKRSFPWPNLRQKWPMTLFWINYLNLRNVVLGIWNFNVRRMENMFLLYTVEPQALLVTVTAWYCPKCPTHYYHFLIYCLSPSELQSFLIHPPVPFVKYQQTPSSKWGELGEKWRWILPTKSLFILCRVL
jgi:hypothetical protein